MIGYIKQKRKIFVYMMLALIIVVQLVYSAYMFTFKKQGYHSDEVYSYGLANSYYQPFISYKDGVFIDDANDANNSDIFINYRELIDGKTLNDYITVQKGQRFSYGSVYHNQTLDHHPPLYYFVLHTVCSFFPDSFSRYYAFALNLVFMALTQIFLFKLMRFICKADAPALCCCLLYGAGTGALSTVMFLRQYCFITMLLTMFVYFGVLANERITDGEDKSPVKALVGMGISGFCLFLTNYSIIAFCGVFTALMCIYLLCRKKYKYMFIYGATVLVALLVSFAAFPYVFKHVFGYSDTYSKKMFSFFPSFRIVCNYVFSQTVGFGVSIYKTNLGAILLTVIVLAAAVLVPLGFLFRKEKWFIRISGSFKAALKAIPSWLRKANYVPLILIICLFVQIAVTAVLVDVGGMGVWSRRYIFMLYPIACLAVVFVMTFIVKHLPKIGKNYAVIILAACVCIAAVTNIKYPSYFYFIHSDKYTDVDKLTNDKNVFVVLPHFDDRGSWFITCYCPYLRHCNKVYFSSSEVSDYDIVKCSDVNMDYVIAPLEFFRLKDMSDEQFNDLIAPRTTDDNGPSTEHPVEDVRASEEPSETEAMIKRLNGGSDFEPLFIMNLHGSLYLVCEIS